MKLGKIVSWLDATLNVAAFDDVANNGLQIGRAEEAEAEVKTVAFAVDASVRAVKAAAAAGAGLLVVHHGISWGGGIRRLTGGVGKVVRAAMGADLALYACHVPLDAHPALGNNAQLAHLLGLKQVTEVVSKIRLVSESILNNVFEKHNFLRLQAGVLIGGEAVHHGSNLSAG